MQGKILTLSSCPLPQYPPLHRIHQTAVRLSACLRQDPQDHLPASKHGREEEELLPLLVCEPKLDCPLLIVVNTTGSLPGVDEGIELFFCNRYISPRARQGDLSVQG